MYTINYIHIDPFEDEKRWVTKKNLVIMQNFALKLDKIKHKILWSYKFNSYNH